LHFDLAYQHMHTLLQPGTRSWRSFILSLIFSLRTYFKISLHNVKIKGYKGSFRERKWLVGSYSFCKTMTVSGLTSSCSDMNVILWRLWRFWVTPVLFVIICTASSYPFGLFLCLHLAIFVPFTFVRLAALCIWIFTGFSSLKWKTLWDLGNEVTLESEVWNKTILA